MNNEEHLIYVDESGIHKSIEHSSFVFVYVLMRDKDLIQDEIIKVEKSLQISHFHWSDLSTQHGWSIRKKFIERTSRLPFMFRYSVLKNPIKTVEGLHNSMFTLLDKNTAGEIYIDGKQPKWFERQFKRSLRDRGFSVRKIRMVDDINEPIIRLADALANVIRIYHDNPNKLVVELFSCVVKKVYR